MQKEKGCISFEIENARIYITLDDGFFNLDKTSSRLHSHGRYEFHLTIEGETLIETEKEVYKMSAMEGFIIKPSTIHDCLLSLEHTLKTSFWFSFEKTKKAYEKDIFGVLQKAFATMENVHKFKNGERYIAILKEIMPLFYSDNVFAEEKIKNLFSLLILQLAEELLPFHGEMGDVGGLSAVGEKNLRKIMIEEYINLNYGRNITLASLGEVLHLSEKQAGRVVKSEFGESFKKYLTKFRINVSMQLLRQTDLPIIKIAYLVGYKSYNGFYKPFSEIVGMTPESFRDKR